MVQTILIFIHLYYFTLKFNVIHLKFPHLFIIIVYELLYLFRIIFNLLL